MLKTFILSEIDATKERIVKLEISDRQKSHELAKATKEIQELKNSGKYFTESELKRILLHLAKGLQYIHSKMLVHLDIKPENIFISLEHPVTSPIRTMSSNDGSDQVSTGNF